MNTYSVKQAVFQRIDLADLFVDMRGWYTTNGNEEKDIEDVFIYQTEDGEWTGTIYYSE
jgi:hypothetical protein